jgi:hypothetical protein
MKKEKKLKKKIQSCLQVSLAGKLLYMVLF